MKNSGCGTPRSPGSVRRTQAGFQPNYRTTAQPRLKKILKDHLAQSFMGERAQMRLSSTLSNCLLKPSIYGYFILSLGRLVQWLIVLTIKSCFFLNWRGNLCWNNLCALSLPPTCIFFHVSPCEVRGTVLLPTGKCSASNGAIPLFHQPSTEEFREALWFLPSCRSTSGGGSGWPHQSSQQGVVTSECPAMSLPAPQRWQRALPVPLCSICREDTWD